MTVTLFDTSICSPNIGDQIIMDAVNTETERLFPCSYIFRVPTHDHLGKNGRKALRRADYVLAGGTNLLFSHWKKRRQWRLSFHDLLAASGKCLLMGTGWAAYMDPPDLMARLAYKTLLSRSGWHSVRDNYSVQNLRSAGFSNVLNTGCPTLWQLTPEVTSVIPSQPGRVVVTTVTDYAQSPTEDRFMLQALVNQYERVHLWPQGVGDMEYARSLDVSGWSALQPSLTHFDEFLKTGPNPDYVGTRLHAGIRAIQHKRRSLIISLDNRAREMGRDFDLPVVERGDNATLLTSIGEARQLRLRLPWDAIAQWRNQSFAKSMGPTS